jgi:hypothetical protein
MMYSGNVSSRTVEVVVEVVYSRRWVGSITVNGMEESWQGDGVSSRILTRPENANRWVVGVSAQKLDSSLEMLTINIWDNGGKLIERISTKTPFEAIAISVSL